MRWRRHGLRPGQNRSPGGSPQRPARRCYGLALCCLLACDVTGVPRPDPVVVPARVDATTACEETRETCNGLDDDCDGQADEQMAADADCEERLVHSETYCQRPEGLCIPGECHQGHWDCDGRPQNGCESTRPCGTSPGPTDAGDEDAGSGDEDAGS